ncbi:hypothetical protein O3G_MSEX000298 [Manduca sexta]|nr:hypothetical protein O3G_MSEX000298 [Manduca sexta]KAG6438880.1 hypothetical protein O3G_MSEX000298 [Manduca sexta]KAG6438881.1 hypothetical protein O3G_MSEX000298 [Manduca sexta]KAG6438882.1 hypothetical protein O3G_MSEX000298 [Manduca sexta]KAG6438883.1 hypothetical protein O3G_MSEX000298 [Manduca sexta]
MYKQIYVGVFDKSNYIINVSIEMIIFKIFKNTHAITDYYPFTTCVIPMFYVFQSSKNSHSLSCKYTCISIYFMTNTRV